MTRPSVTSPVLEPGFPYATLLTFVLSMMCACNCSSLDPLILLSIDPSHPPKTHYTTQIYAASCARTNPHGIGCSQYPVVEPGFPHVSLLTFVLSMHIVYACGYPPSYPLDHLASFQPLQRPITIPISMLIMSHSIFKSTRTNPHSISCPIHPPLKPDCDY